MKAVGSKFSFHNRNEMVSLLALPGKWLSDKKFKNSLEVITRAVRNHEKD